MDHARKSLSLTDNLNEPGEVRSLVHRASEMASRRSSFDSAPGEATDRAHTKVNIPDPSKWWVRGFSWYGLRYVGKHFNAVRLSKSGVFPEIPEGAPIVVYLNHASWWDPMIGMVAWRFLFQERKVFTPIDADALEKYQFFKKLGFFGVTPGKASGARRFLSVAKLILQPDRNSVLMVTPQGRFADVRERPVKFLPGLGALALKIPGVMFVPMSVEYCFWDEKKPEALLRFGSPVSSEEIQQKTSDMKGASDLLESGLLNSMDQLKKEAIRRDPGLFHSLLNGKSGVSPVYDCWRRFRSWIHGKEFNAAHVTHKAANGSGYVNHISQH